MVLRYKHGLQPVAEGVYAYLQPNGGWGLNNAGLVVSGGESLLIDTLFDRPRTRRMLEDMARATDAARHIDILVNTHGNGDHWYGNGAVTGAEIVASTAAAREMALLPPAKMAMLMRVAEMVQRSSLLLRPVVEHVGKLGLPKPRNFVDAAPFVSDLFSAFEFGNNEPVYPTRTFEGEIELTVGQRSVRVIDFGPGHSLSDAIVHIPDVDVVFAGDLLFCDAHPIVWKGPVSRVLASCERILALKPSVIVAGHGPITNCDGLERQMRYLETLKTLAKREHDSGISAEEAVGHIELDVAVDWEEAERLIVNLDTIYRELSYSDPEPPNVIESFARMARLRQR
jgi:cyclase